MSSLLNMSKKVATVDTSIEGEEMGSFSAASDVPVTKPDHYVITQKEFSCYSDIKTGNPKTWDPVTARTASRAVEQMHSNATQLGYHFAPGEADAFVNYLVQDNVSFSPCPGSRVTSYQTY